jgi:hypothetical protein
LVEWNGQRADNVGGSRRGDQNFAWGRKWYRIELPAGKNSSDIAQVGLQFALYGKRTAVYTDVVTILPARSNKTEEIEGVPDFDESLTDEDHHHNRGIATFWRPWFFPGIGNCHEGVFNRTRRHRRDQESFDEE